MEVFLILKISNVTFLFRANKYFDLLFLTIMQYKISKTFEIIKIKKYMTKKYFIKWSKMLGFEVGYDVGYMLEAGSMSKSGFTYHNTALQL